MNSSYIEIRKMTYADIPYICKADNDESESSINYYNNNLKAQENNECSAFIAICNGQVAGYVFLYYQCRWGGLKNQGLPSIVDLIVFESFRRKGIATKLMDKAEEEASTINKKIYLDVCMNSDYGPAQRLYIKRGYVPDGAGVYYEQRVLGLNEKCCNDDELTLCLVKSL